VDEVSGGCCDGLKRYGLNCNQGAESTLAWIQSAALMRLASRISTFLPYREAAHPVYTAAA
jgi:hypothetical protein